MADTQTAPKKVCEGCGTYEGHSHLPGCWVETRAEYEARSASVPHIADVPSGDTALPELVLTDEDRAAADVFHERNKRSGTLSTIDSADWFLVVEHLVCRERQLLYYKAKYEAALRAIEELKGNR